MRTILWVIWKELHQIRRNRQMRGIILMAPVIQLIILGYAATTDVKDLSLAVCDLCQSSASRDVIRDLEGSGYFRQIASVSRPAEMEALFLNQSADLGLVFARGFSRSLELGQETSIQALFDGSDAVRASTALAYAGGVVAARGRKILLERMERSGIRLEIGSVGVVPRVWYNPDLQSVRFMLPGIVALILMVTTIGLTGTALVREREIGTMEQLIVTPMHPYQLLIGKMIPFALLGMVNVVIVTTVATFWFGVPVRGSIPLLLLLSGGFLTTTLGLGLLVSTFSRTQQQAMLLSAFFVMMPFNLLSGFIFPIESMPQLLQWATYPIPLRYFLVIIRGIFLKGIGWAELWDQALAMMACGIAVMTISILRFKKRLD